MHMSRHGPRIPRQKFWESSCSIVAIAPLSCRSTPTNLGCVRAGQADPQDSAPFHSNSEVSLGTGSVKVEFGRHPTRGRDLRCKSWSRHPFDPKAPAYFVSRLRTTRIDYVGSKVLVART